MKKYKFLKLLNDKTYLKIKYYLTFHKKLNLKNPITFNEKIQWLKLNDRKKNYIQMVDKYEAKNYVSNIIGKKYIIPTIGLYNSFDEIDFSKLPNKFVLKCTHDSGGIVICRDKEKLDYKKTKTKINKSLKSNYYYHSREWAYKFVKPRIIIEEYMEDKDEKELKDYKFFCFNGNPKIILVCSERYSSSNMCETWFDENWNLLNIIENNHRVDKNQKCPINFEKMKELSRILSKNIPFIRVDFYEINNKIYFGELTFCPAGGMEKFEPEEWDKILGDYLKIN